MALKFGAKSTASLCAPAFALALTLSACSGSNPADKPSEVPSVDPSIGAVDAGQKIEAREDNFKAIAKSMKATKAALDGSSPDFGAITDNATSMVENAEKIPALFPEGTGPESGEKTEALPAIWQRPDDFQAAAMKLVNATMDLRAAAQKKDAEATKTAFGKVGMACKSCHEDFRQEKKKD